MATTTNATTQAPLEAAIAKKQRSIAARGPGYYSGAKIIKQVVSLASTDLQNGDSVDILTFPGRCFLTGLWIKITDVDTNGTPALTFDIRADSDVLINNSTAGQAGGNDQLDADLDPVLLDVSGSVLKFVPETSAATAAAGTLTVYAAINTDGVIDSF